MYASVTMEGLSDTREYFWYTAQSCSCNQNSGSNMQIKRIFIDDFSDDLTNNTKSRLNTFERHQGTRHKTNFPNLEK